MHRLDVATAGVVLVATTKRSARLLSQQFASGSVQKTYRGIVAGDASAIETTWDDWITKIDHEPRVTAMRIRPESQDLIVFAESSETSSVADISEPSPSDLGPSSDLGPPSDLGSPCDLGSSRDPIPPNPAAKRATTRVVQVNYHAESRRSHLILRPTTGRMHQLRIGAASRGFPIIGDTMYGFDGINGVPPATIDLRAVGLRFRDPVSARWVDFQCADDAEDAL